MSDVMVFPETWEEFEKSYGFIDKEKVYTNGSRLITSFRVEQWLDYCKDKKTSPPWHTGTPTERDYYWIAYRYHDIGLMEYAKAEYCGGGWIVLSDDYEHEKILAWQKITPFEGEK